MLHGTFLFGRGRPGVPGGRRGETAGQALRHQRVHPRRRGAHGIGAGSGRSGPRRHEPDRARLGREGQGSHDRRRRRAAAARRRGPHLPRRSRGRRPLELEARRAGRGRLTPNSRVRLHVRRIRCSAQGPRRSTEKPANRPRFRQLLRRGLQGPPGSKTHSQGWPDSGFWASFVFPPSFPPPRFSKSKRRFYASSPATP